MKRTLTLEDMYEYQENLEKRKENKLGEGRRARQKRNKSKRDALSHREGEYIELTGVFKVMSKGMYVIKNLVADDGQTMNHLNIRKRQITNINQDEKFYIEKNQKVKLTGIVEYYYHEIDGQINIQYQLGNLTMELI